MRLGWGGIDHPDVSIGMMEQGLIPRHGHPPHPYPSYCLLARAHTHHHNCTIPCIQQLYVQQLRLLKARERMDNRYSSSSLHHGLPGCCPQSQIVAQIAQDVAQTLVEKYKYKYKCPRSQITQHASVTLNCHLGIVHSHVTLPKIFPSIVDGHNI